MAFVVEDGTGIANANSYLSIADYKTYFTDRGNAAAVALDDIVIQSNLVKATDYVEMRFRSRFVGIPLTLTQALSFPRDDTPWTGVPQPLQSAIAEYAIRANAGPLAPDPQFDATARQPVKQVEKVGPIDTETTYASRGAPATMSLFRPYPQADNLLAPLLIPGNTVLR